MFGFGVPLRGSFLLLLGLTQLFLLNTLGLGLLVSTLVRTQQQAMMVAAFVLMVPMIYLSGLIFPIENMPARHPDRELRDPGALLREHPPRDLPEGLGARRCSGARRSILAAMGTGLLTVASLRFRKRLD